LLLQQLGDTQGVVVGDARDPTGGRVGVHDGSKGVFSDTEARQIGRAARPDGVRGVVNHFLGAHLRRTSRLEVVVELGDNRVVIELQDWGDKKGQVTVSCKDEEVGLLGPKPWRLRHVDKGDPLATAPLTVD
jgi:hypothetical protein